MDVTIVIPTYNRPIKLKRTLAYYKKIPKSFFQLLIADSSTKEAQKENIKTVRLFGGNKINYKIYSSEINLFTKLAEVSKTIKTKYAVVCGDDDFVITPTISVLVKFLEINQDYVAAHGKYVGFIKHQSEKKMSESEIYPSTSIDEIDVRDRLQHHFSDYYPTMFAVHKTKILNKVLIEGRRFTNDNRFGELLPSMLTVNEGKVKKLTIFIISENYHPIL